MAKMNLYAEKDKELFGEVRKLKDQTSGDFNRVFDLSKKYIHKIIYDIVKNEDDTEDIMQETYLQIYNKIDTLEKPDAFYVWAGRIATNKTLRYIQKNRREMLVEADEDGETDFVFERMSEDTEKFIPEAVLMDMEKQRIIADILDKLPLEQKICVQFFYYEEMSVKEIAQAFGCSEGTVKSRLNYARKAIKDAVIDMDELYCKAADPKNSPRFFREYLRIIQKIVFLELQFDQRRCERRGIDRNIKLFQDIGYGADMILVPMCDNQTANSARIVSQVGDIRKNHIDSIHIFIRKSHSAIDQQKIIAEFNNRHIFPDFTQTAEWYNFKLRCHSFSFPLYS